MARNDACCVTIYNSYDGSEFHVIVELVGEAQIGRRSELDVRVRLLITQTREVLKRANVHRYKIFFLSTVRLLCFDSAHLGNCSDSVGSDYWECKT